MRKFSRESFNITQAINELMHESGVIVIENAYNLNDIKEAREIVNHFADTQEQKETHFNAEAEASDKIKLQQRIWNLFGKGEVFSKLITNDIIFSLMSKLLGSEFFCGSYCASRLLPGSIGQELHIDYPYWDFYNSETSELIDIDSNKVVIQKMPKAPNGKKIKNIEVFINLQN